MKLSLNEIAMRLYKPNWADAKEYKQALNALSKLTDKELKQVATIGQRYSIKRN